MIRKVYTSCCALNQMVVQNDENDRPEPFWRIKRFVESSKKESECDWSDQRQGGAKALFCMTAPFEQKLEYNLEKLGFKHIHTINRRVGYKPGQVKMWILNW